MSTLNKEQSQFLETFKAIDSHSLSGALAARYGKAFTPSGINSRLEGVRKSSAGMSSQGTPEIIQEYIFDSVSYGHEADLIKRIFDRFGYEVTAGELHKLIQVNNCEIGRRPARIDFEVSEAIYNCSAAGLSPKETEREIAKHLRVLVTERRIIAHLKTLALGAFR